MSNMAEYWKCLQEFRLYNTVRETDNAKISSSATVHKKHDNHPQFLVVVNWSSARRVLKQPHLLCCSLARSAMDESTCSWHQPTDERPFHCQPHRNCTERRADYLERARIFLLLRLSRRIRFFFHFGLMTRDGSKQTARLPRRKRTWVCAEAANMASALACSTLYMKVHMIYGHVNIHVRTWLMSWSMAMSGCVHVVIVTWNVHQY